MANKELRWQPLEANPDVMNKYVDSLGLTKSWQFVDVLSLDFLEMIPRPCCAFILLFPCSDNYLQYCKDELQNVEKDPPIVNPDVYFMKQTIGNACGTIALLHCIANNAHQSEFIKENSPIQEFLMKTKDMNKEERGKTLENDENICSRHKSSAREGQSREVSADEEVNYHFVGIVKVGGQIYELDGRKPYPVNHGKCDDNSDFVVEAAKVCRKFMSRDPEETRFNIIALSRVESDQLIQ